MLNIGYPGVYPSVRTGYRGYPVSPDIPNTCASGVHGYPTILPCIHGCTRGIRLYRAISWLYEEYTLYTACTPRIRAYTGVSSYTGYLGVYTPISGIPRYRGIWGIPQIRGIWGYPRSGGHLGLGLDSCTPEAIWAISRGSFGGHLGVLEGLWEASGTLFWGCFVTGA